TRDLLEFGPMKPENEKGYTDEQLDELAKNDGNPDLAKPRQEVVMNGFKFYQVTCPTGTRVGLAAGEEATMVINASLELAEKDNVKANKCLLKQQLDEAFSNIKGAIAMVYPQGLPEWDPSREAIENNEDLEGTAASKQVYNPAESSLWWASKELQRGKLLSDFVGKNEKTKLIVKLQRKGQGPPVKEAPISEQEQKNMMAYYYRKQEELKKLDENEDDDYLASNWANPKSLKNAFNGIRDVKWGYK
ncbi:hypothetical protein HDV02_000868, partial [Globomyces sp. JEL0801]